MAPVSLSTLARFGFDEPEAAAEDLERLGAWPPAAAAGGARLLADIAARARAASWGAAEAAMSDSSRFPPGAAAGGHAPSRSRSDAAAAGSSKPSRASTESDTPAYSSGR